MRANLFAREVRLLAIGRRDFGDAKVGPAWHTPCFLSLSLALPVIIATNAHTYILSLAFKLAHAFKFNQPWHAAACCIIWEMQSYSFPVPLVCARRRFKDWRP
jgi:hypothetical protein